jgi:hypothetical protein
MDNHTLYVKCEGATFEDIKLSFTDAISEYQKKYDNNLTCSFRINLLEDKNNISLGIAYVFLTNPAVYYMILGKNPDGSDRIEYRDDPSYGNSSNWITITKNNNPKPKIPIILPSLITLKPYKLSPEHINIKRQKLIDDNKDKKLFDSSLISIPEEANFNVSGAFVLPLEDKFMPNILKCKNIPSWLTAQDLKIEFTPYASDSSTMFSRVVKGKTIKETYPWVNINDEGIGFIVFDPSTLDAQFALHMMKKTTFTKNVNGVQKTITLIFYHSYKSDRDLITEINNRPKLTSNILNEITNNNNLLGKNTYFLLNNN